MLFSSLSIEGDISIPLRCNRYDEGNRTVQIAQKAL